MDELVGATAVKAHQHSVLVRLGYVAVPRDSTDHRSAGILSRGLPKCVLPHGTIHGFQLFQTNLDISPCARARQNSWQLGKSQIITEQESVRDECVG